MDGFNVGSIVAHLRADTAQFTTAIDEAKQKSGGLGDTVAGVGKVIAAAFAVAGVAAAGFAALSLKAYSESEETMAQVNQVLNSTGKVAHISASGVDAVAKSMEQYSGKTRDSIEQGQIILLQFRQVTAKTLPEFSKAMVDVSQRMGVDMVTAAKTLGIALDDPAAGLGRLKKSGIDFTESQKAAIKALQASGDITGADALLMKSLEERVGGAAGAYRNTLGGSISAVKSNIKDFEVVVGATIAKYLEPLAKSLANALSKIDWQKVINNTIIVLKLLWATLTLGDINLNKNELQFAGLASRLGKIQVVIQDVVDAFGRVWDTLKVVADFLVQMFAPSLEALVKTVQDKLLPQIMKLWGVLQPGLTEVLKYAAIVIGAVIVAAIWIFINVLNVAITVLGGVIHWTELVIGWFGNIAGVIWNFFRGLPNFIEKAWGDYYGFFSHIGQQLIQGLIDGVESMVKKLENKIKSVTNGVKDIAKKVLGVFSPSTVFHEIGMNVGQGLINGINTMQDAVGSASSNMAMSAVAPAVGTVNNASTNNNNSSTINTSITGPINIGNNADADKFLRKLTYNQELAKKGLTPVR